MFLFQFLYTGETKHTQPIPTHMQTHMLLRNKLTVQPAALNHAIPFFFPLFYPQLRLKQHTGD